MRKKQLQKSRVPGGLEIQAKQILLKKIKLRIGPFFLLHVALAEVRYCTISVSITQRIQTRRMTKRVISQ